MEPINKQVVLIRLLKDGHISNEEFKCLIQSPKGMHPKTWAFLKKSSEFTQLEKGFEDKLQTVQPKKGGGFWVTVEGNGV